MKFLFPILILLFCSSLAEAHSTRYQVENKDVSVRVFYSADEPASCSAYEIFGPNDTIRHKKGRTDKNGFVSFLPDRPGKWIIKVSGDSDHGLHGTQIEILVNEGLFMESFKKPLIAQYTTAIVGAGFILGIFGIWALLKMTRRQAKTT